MKDDKKIWKTPELTVHGTIQDLTQNGGGLFVDVPQGTPVSNGINSVTGSDPFP